MTEDPEETRNCREGERRVSGHRYEIAVRVWFTWRLSDGTMGEGTGTTRNISSRGVCVVSREAPPFATVVDVMVAVPPVNREAESSGRLRGTGIVLRVCEESGFAAEVAFHLERAGASPKRSRQNEALSRNDEINIPRSTQIH